jgi:glutamine amidotransferase
MCRLLGVIASESTEFGLGLTRAPRCLAALSREHRDGWGIAIHDADRADVPVQSPWDLHRGTAPAGEDDRFHAIATRSRGHMLVAHVRQKTVGPTKLENSHPFVRDGWVFAHNGTIHATDTLRAECSRTRLREITGDTDSELFFAHLLTCFDQRGLTVLDSEASRTAAAGLVDEVTTRLRRARIGAFNFLLSDGTTTFAHRCGRSLFVLDRGPNDPVLETRTLGHGATLTTRWTARRQAILIASEHITEEPWREVPDGTLIHIERVPQPRIVKTTSA